MSAIVDELLREWLPRAGRCERDDRRLVHEYLGDLEDFEIWRESQRARFIVAWTDDLWAVDRLRAVSAELAERRREERRRNDKRR